jgi:hypothetical protein
MQALTRAQTRLLRSRFLLRPPDRRDEDDTGPRLFGGTAGNNELNITSRGLHSR